MSIDVSIIMPSYNVRPYIEKCLQSVVDQTLKNIEIICVDAGSDDGTLEILQDYEKRDSRIRLLISDKKSYGYQMNLGIHEASGKYIGIVETDDYIAEKMYEKLFTCAEEDDLDCASCSYYSFFEIENGEALKPERLFDIGADIWNKCINPVNYPEIIGNDGAIWKAIYRKDLWDNEKVFNESQGAAYQDIGFGLWAYSKIHRIKYLPDCMYFYRTDREASSTRNLNVLRYLYQEFKRLLEDSRIIDESKEIQKGVYLRMSKCFLREYDRVLEYTEYDKSNEYIGEYLDFFVEKLSRAKGDEIISEQDLSEQEWDKLNSLISNIDSYVSTQKQQKELDNEKRDKLFEAVRGQNVIVFGCGAYGQEVINYIYGMSDAKVVGLCDNDRNKWGQKLLGCKIYPLSEALVEFNNNLWVIANKNHSDEIKAQLLENGITHLYVWTR